MICVFGKIQLHAKEFSLPAIVKKILFSFLLYILFLFFVCFFFFFYFKRDILLY